MLVLIFPVNAISNTDSATSDLLRQKELIHADVRQHAVFVEEEFLQVAGRIALLLFMSYFANDVLLLFGFQFWCRLLGDI